MRAVAAAGAVAILALALGSGIPAAAQERSERIGEVRIEARLHDDGALAVNEQRQFVYSGTFSGAFYSLPLDTHQQVVDIGVRDDSGHVYEAGRCSADGPQEPGRVEVSRASDELRIVWCYPEPLTDTTVTMDLSYVVTGVGTRHADASQLHWKWVGEGWDVPSDRVVAEVELPGGPYTAGEDLLIWGHGPLHGTIEQTGPDTVRLDVPALSPNTFIELRALMPPEALAAASSDGDEVRADIVEAEQCLAVAADADRARARGETPEQDCDPQGWLGWFGNPLLLLGLLGGSATWYGLFRRHGKEHDLPADLAHVDYVRELPSDDPPVMVDWLTNWGKTTDQALVATILDLAQRGSIRLRRDTQVRERLLRSDKEEEVLWIEPVERSSVRWEAEVLGLLFDRIGTGGPITDQQLRDWVEKNRKEAYEWWQRWTQLIRAEAKARDWIEPHVWVGVSVLLGVAMIGAATAAWLWLRGNLALAIVCALAGVAAAALSPLMRRRTPNGRALHHQWRRFGAYLTDYSLMKEHGPEYLRMWGRFLVYAVPLGVGDTVMRNLDASLSRAEMEQVAGGWYPVYGGAGRPSFAATMSSIAAGVPSSTIASSPSSSGGGGGFSGGGGGGGGSGGGSF